MLKDLASWLLSFNIINLLHNSINGPNKALWVRWVHALQKHKCSSLNYKHPKPVLILLSRACSFYYANLPIIFHHADLPVCDLLSCSNQGHLDSWQVPFQGPQATATGRRKNTLPLETVQNASFPFLLQFSHPSAE